MDRIVAIKITSDGRAFVVDQEANAGAAAKFGTQIEEAGKKAETAGAKVAAAGKTAKDTGAGLKKAGEEAGGAGDGFKKSGDGAGAATPKVRQLGTAAQQTAQQMRQVAPQITDIVTQVAAGQNPLQIFIQQGGQLKDVFGGAGPAVRAVGGYVASMINPLSVAAVALGGLAVAYHLGAEESAAFNRQMLLSGNAAGATNSEYHAMASGLSAIAGTKAAALEAVTQMAEGGRVGAAELQRYSGIAQQLDRLVGKPVADTAKEFAALAEAPVEASLKLTQTYNYLTAAVYEQIRALRDEGQHVEAAKLAQEAFAQAMDERIPKMQANLGLIARSWMSIKDAIKGAGNALMDIGREVDIGKQIETLQAAIQQRKERNQSLGISDGKATQELERQLGVLQEKERTEKKTAFAAAERLATVQAAARFDKTAEASLEKQEKLRRAIQQIEADGMAGQKSRQQIDAAIANERKKYEEKADGSAHQDALSARLARIRRATEAEVLVVKEGVQAVTHARSIGAISQAEYIDTIAAIELQAMEVQRAGLKGAIDAAGAKKNSLREVADLQGQLIIKEEEIAARRRKIDQDQRQRRDKLAQEQSQEATKAYQQTLEALEKNGAALQADAEKQEEHNQTIGQSKVAIAELTAAKLEDQAVSKDRLAALADEIDWSGRMGAAYREQAEQLRRLALAKRDGAARETFQEGLKKQERDFEKFVDNIDETFHDGFSAMLDENEGAWKSWTHSLGNTFKTTVADAIYRMFAKPFVVQVAGSFMGGGGAGGGALGMASNGFSLYNGLSSVSTVGSQWMAGSMSAANAGGTLFANATGSGIHGLLATNGAYGTAGGSAAGGGMPAAAGFAVILAPLFAALADGFFDGERRGGAQYAYSFDGQTAFNARRGTSVAASGIGATFLEGPSGGDPAADATKLIINSTVAGIGDALKALGSNATLTGYQAAYETSTLGNGGVFAGGTLSNGVTFGEPGTVAGTDGLRRDDPRRSLFEVGSQADTNGSPEKLAIDAAQSYIAAIQASVGIIPQLVSEQFTYMGVDPGAGGQDANFGEQELQGTRWIRVFDEAVNQSVKELGLLPKMIADLVVGIDPESLTDARTKDIATKIQTMVANVNGFRAIVENLPFEYLKDSTFDWAASLVAAAEGLDAAQTGLETLNGLLQSYYANFYTEEEKRLNTAKNVQSTLAKAGVNMSVEQILSMTSAQFRGTVEAFRAMGEQGQPAYLALLSVNAAVASLIPVAEEVGQAVVTLDNVAEARRRLIAEYESEQSTLEATVNRFRDFARNIRDFRDSLLLSELSPLTPAQRYAEAKQQFETIKAAADGGDVTAQGQLSGAGNAFLSASREYFASSDQYTADFYMVQQALTNSAISADATADVAKLQLDAINAQLGFLTSIDSTATTMLSALQDYHAAVIAAVAAGLDVNPGDVAAIGPEQLVTHLYRALLDRVPEAEGMAYWTARLGSGESLESIIAGIKNSPEYINGSHFDGLDTVPFNGYRAKLHVGETVLNQKASGALRDFVEARGQTGAEGMTDVVRVLAQRFERLERAIEAGAILNAEATERNTVQISDSLVEGASLGGHQVKLKRGAALV